MKFIHTSDWQLGMTRRFLMDGAQELYDQARFDAIRSIGRLAAAEKCDFVVVAGDVFESNRIGKKTLLRAIDAIRSIPVPVFLLPGNHDPLVEASVYASRRFLDNRPENVVVLADFAPVTVMPGVEVVGAPWRSKRPIPSPVVGMLEALPPAEGILRVCVSHGAVRGLFNDEDETAISVDLLGRALADGKIHYVALGDKHSVEQVDTEGRIWYSGTPEVVAFREPNPGFVNLVEIGGDRVAVEQKRTGKWTFAELAREDIERAEDMNDLFRRLAEFPDKPATAVRMKLAGMLDAAALGESRRRLDDLRDLFASLEVEETIHLRVDRLDGDLGLSGFSLDAARELRDMAAQSTDDASTTAEDALMLLLRLAREDGE